MPLSPRRLDFIKRILRVGVGSSTDSGDTLQPAGAENSVQARSGNVLRGAERVYLTSDGRLVVTSDPTTAPTTGSINGSSSFSLRTLLSSIVKTVIQSAANGLLTLGGTHNDPTSAYLNTMALSRYLSALRTFTSTPGVGPIYDADVGAFGKLDTVYACSGGYLSPNAILGRPPSPAIDHFKGASGVTWIPNITTLPASNPDDGGFVYVEGGALKYRGSSGTVTTLAPA